MKKLVFVMIAQEGGSRMNVSSANPSQDSRRWYTVQGNILGSSVGADKHYRNIG